MLADNMLELLKLKSFELVIIKNPATWEHLLSQLSSGNLSVLNFKVIVLFLGRADMHELHAEVEVWLDRVLATVKAINPKASIVLSACSQIASGYRRVKSFFKGQELTTRG